MAKLSELENTIQTEEYPDPLRVVCQDNFERNKVVKNARNLKEAEEFYLKMLYN